MSERWSTIALLGNIIKMATYLRRLELRDTAVQVEPGLLAEHPSCAECPSCGEPAPVPGDIEDYLGGLKTFCPHCGQALTWETFYNDLATARERGAK